MRGMVLVDIFDCEFDFDGLDCVVVANPQNKALWNEIQVSHCRNCNFILLEALNQVFTWLSSHNIQIDLVYDDYANVFQEIGG